MLLRKAEEGRAQSKTLRAARSLLKGAKRPGVRQSSGALSREPRCANFKMNWIKAPNSNIHRICVLTTASPGQNDAIEMGVERGLQPASPCVGPKAWHPLDRTLRLGR